MDSGGEVVAPLQTPAITQPTLLGVLWAGTVISFAVLVVRITLRLKLVGRFTLDDYLVIAAFGFDLASTLIWTVLSGNLYLTLTNVANPDLAALLDLLDRVATSLHGNLASYFCTWTCIYLVKLAFMVFFHGLGKQIRFQRILWWCVLVLLVASYAVTLGLMEYKCLTSSGMDVIANCRTQENVEFGHVITRVQTALDIVTDALIVLVSGNIVWRAKVEWKKKLMLSAICCLTVAMILVAIIRMAIGAPGKVPDLSWLLLWNSVEMTLAILVSCAASFRSLYTQKRTQQENESLALQQQSEAQTSRRRSPKSSFARDTMLDTEYSRLEDPAPQDSQEALWTTHGREHPAPHALPSYEAKVVSPSVAYWPTWTQAPTR